MLDLLPNPHPEQQMQATSCRRRTPARLRVRVRASKNNASGHREDLWLLASPGAAGETSGRSLAELAEGRGDRDGANRWSRASGKSNI